MGVIEKSNDDSTQAENARISSIMSRWIGNNRHITVSELSAVSGVPESSIRMGMDPNQAAMCWAKIIKIMQFMPPAFANALLEGTGFIVKLENPEPISGFELQARMAKRMDMLADQLRDGMHTHIEKAELKPEIVDLIGDCSQFLAS